MGARLPERHRFAGWIAGAAVLLGALPLAANGRECLGGTVYLTFDTGGMHSAELIAEVLRAEGVKATFFLANERTFRGDYSLDASWGPYWKRLAADGHRFGNHTWSHLYRWRDLDGGRVQASDSEGRQRTLDEQGFCRELRRVEEAFQRDTGRRLSGLWRAPGGRTTAQTVRWAARCGYPLHVHWDDAGFIGDELPSEQYPNRLLLERALKNLRNGDIVMMHLGIWSRNEPAAPILKPLIQGLKGRGMCFATVDAGQR